MPPSPQTDADAVNQDTPLNVAAPGLTATATVSITVNSGITTSGFYLGTTGSSADNYDLISSPPPAAAPVPDFDADGDPGLTLKSSDGKDTITDPAKYHLWTSVAASPLALDGPVTLDLWSSIRNFDTGKDATVYASLYDRAAISDSVARSSNSQFRTRPAGPAT